MSRTRSGRETLAGFAASSILALGMALPGCAQTGVRPPAVAGSFYPAEARKLELTIKGFLADAIPPGGERPIAIVAPHAGYPFSGQIAADSFRQATGYPVDVVVILGPAHTVPPFEGVSVFQGTGYRTPLGVANIDREVASALASADKRFAYRPEAHAKEHSEEVEVPFVQVAFPQAKIVTAIVGTSDPKVVEPFAAALARVLAKRNALIVASSDLSHYPSQADAVETDRATLKAVASLDPRVLTGSIATQEQKHRRNLVTCACGEAPILVAMHAARALGARRARVVSYANSGDSLEGDAERVVGYGSVIFTKEEGASDSRAVEVYQPAAAAAPLTPADRQALLKLARKTLERTMATGIAPLPRADSPVLRRKQGAFVTLNIRGELRGCIGQMTADEPLARTVAKMTIEAATGDPRFPPVREQEVPSIDIEVSVLTPFSRVSTPEAVQVGRDGVLLDRDGRRAVFLPQVAPEQHWNREQMLENLCLKAGLDRGCWKKATLYTFQADVFGEPQRK